MKLKSILLGLTAAAVSTGVAFAQMQPIPNPPETPKPAAAKHHAKKHSTKKHAAKKAEAKPAASSNTSGDHSAAAPK